jgi:hypothetical protein
MDTSLFFDDYEKSSEVQLFVDDVCSSCVVRKQCLEYAEEQNLEGGVFGRKYFKQGSKNRKKRQKA